MCYTDIWGLYIPSPQHFTHKEYPRRYRSINPRIISIETRLSSSSRSAEVLVFPEMKGVAEGSLITASVCSLALQTNRYGHLDMTMLWYIFFLTWVRQRQFLQLTVQYIATIRLPSCCYAKGIWITNVNLY